MSDRNLVEGFKRCLHDIFQRPPHGYRKGDKTESDTFWNALRITFFELGCPENYWDLVKHDEITMYTISAQWACFEEYRCSRSEKHE